MNYPGNRAIALLIAILGLMLGDQSQAQSESEVLEEIVVTTRRVSESLQDVPLSVTAFTEETLETSKIHRFEDLRSRVPNLQYSEFNIGLPRYYIRGIGSTNRSSAADPAVGVFMDDVYIGRAAGTSGDFLDVARIEVLRGPQGTLFGRNVVGGAIAIHSNRPTDVFESSFEIDIGNHDRFDLRAMVSGPVGDNVAGRIALLSRNYGGHSLNTETGNYLEDQERLGFRGSLLFSPNETVEVLLSAEYGSDDSHGTWWHLGVEGPFSQGRGNPDPRSGRNALDGEQDRSDFGLNLTVNWDLPTGQLTSITGYRDHDFSVLDNTTGLWVGGLTAPDRFRFHHTLFVQGQDQSADQISQEIRFASDNSGRLNWVGGVFGYKEDVARMPLRDWRFIFFRSEGLVAWDANSETSSVGAFGQLRYDASDRWRLTAGLRWTRDQKDSSTTTSGNHWAGFRDNGVRVPGFSSSGSESWSEVTPMVSASFDASDNTMLYGTISKGFKSGGFNDASNEKADTEVPFAPEFAWNYELGLKSEFLNRRARINANLFYVDYEDLQVGIIVQPDPNLPPFGITGNAGSAEVSGLEAEWDILLSDIISFYGSYANTDSETSDIISGGADLTGNKLARAPESKIYAGLAFGFPVSNGSLLNVRLEYVYEDEWFTEITNSDVTKVSSHDLIDASIDWISSNQKWTVRLWGKNLSDELYVTSASEVPVRDGYQKFGPPRTYGVSFAYRSN